mgnify:CR=1 FL=1
MHILLSALLAATPSPSATADPAETFYSPGTIGFIMTFFVTAGAVALIFDMVRRIRRVRYRAEIAEKLAAEFEAAGKSVILDDRAKVSPGVKFGDAELIGVPQIVIVGKGLETGEVDLWNRRTGERRSVKVESALAELG